MPHTGQRHRPDHQLTNAMRVPKYEDLRALEAALSNSEQSVSIRSNGTPIEAVDHATDHDTYLPLGYTITIRRRLNEGGVFVPVPLNDAERAMREVCTALHIESPDIQSISRSAKLNEPHLYVGTRTMGKLCDAATKGRAIS